MIVGWMRCVRSRCRIGVRRGNPCMRGRSVGGGGGGAYALGADELASAISLETVGRALSPAAGPS